jgi:hypothetical protein
MGILEPLRNRWAKHDQRLMQRELYDESIGGGLPEHREEQLDELAASKQMGVGVPLMGLGAGLDACGNVQPGEVGTTPGRC